MNEQYANSIFSNLSKLFGFPSKNFDFNGTQIDGLSKENRSLAREVAFLKEQIKDLSQDFDYSSNQNQIKGIDKLTSGTKIDPITNLDFTKYENDHGADDFLDTAGFMDAEFENMEEDTEVKKEQMSDEEYRPDDNYIDDDYVPDPEYD